MNHPCFNPCSRGCFARSSARLRALVDESSFNPCSRGCFARSRSITRQDKETIRVSILVLVDVSLEALSTGLPLLMNPVSILVLVDVSLEENYVEILSGDR